MGTILFATGALIVALGIIYLLVMAAWWIIRALGLTGFALFNLGYHEMVIKPQLEENGFLAQRQAENAAIAEAKAIEEQEKQQAKIDRAARTLVDKRRVIEAKYPLADKEMIDQYMDVYTNSTVQAAKNFERILANHEMLKARELLADVDTTSLKPVQTAIVGKYPDDLIVGACTDPDGASYITVSKRESGAVTAIEVDSLTAAVLMVNKLRGTSKQMTVDDCVLMAGHAMTDLINSKKRIGLTQDDEFQGFLEA